MSPQSKVQIKNGLSIFKYKYQSFEDGYYSIYENKMEQTLATDNFRCEIPPGYYMVYLEGFKVNEQRLGFRANYFLDNEAFELFDGLFVANWGGRVCQPSTNIKDQMVVCNDNGIITDITPKDNLLCPNHKYIAILSCIDERIECKDSAGVKKIYYPEGETIPQSERSIAENRKDINHFIRIPKKSAGKQLEYDLKKVFMQKVKTCENIIKNGITGACDEFTWDNCVNKCVIDIDKFVLYQTIKNGRVLDERNRIKLFP